MKTVLSLDARAEQVVKDVWGRYSYAPIDQPELIAAIASALRKEIEACIEACMDEYVDAADTKHESDIAYNTAVDDCIAAIRARGAAKDTNGCQI